MNTRPISYLSFLILVLLSGQVFSQSQKRVKEKEKAAKVAQLLDSKRFAFKAQSAQPLRGGNINLTSDYDLTLKGDTLLSYLPYFGRAFSAPYGQTKSPLDLSSTNFTYSAVKGKKGSREINIEVKDPQASVRKYSLNVSEQGYATLQVTNNDRDPITFNGYIAEVK